MGELKVGGYVASGNWRRGGGESEGEGGRVEVEMTRVALHGGQLTLSGKE